MHCLRITLSTVLRTMNLLKTSFKRPDDHDDLQPVIRFDANVYDEPENAANGTSDDVKEEPQAAYGNLSFNYSRVKDEESGVDDGKRAFLVDVHHLARTAKRGASEAGDILTSFYGTNRAWLKPLLLGLAIVLMLVGLVLLIVLTQTRSPDSPDASGLVQFSARRTSTPKWYTLKWNSVTQRKAGVTLRGSPSKPWHSHDRVIPDSGAFHALQCQYKTDLKCQMVHSMRLGCLPSKRQCDGYKDCVDGADEYHCCWNMERPGEFACGSMKRCVNVTLVCDGVRDCPNGADEEEDLCSYRKSACPADKFECAHDGMCIKSEQRCDRRLDCHDESDEKDCLYLCPSGFEMCKHATLGEAEKDHPFCVTRERLCDSTWDCDTGTDEDPEICRETQPTSQCNADSFQCDDDLCIPLKERCDRNKDCSDESDERGCKYECPDDTYVLCDHTTHEGNDHPFCVPKDKVCDGDWHCTDGADENETMCELYATTHDQLTLTTTEPSLDELYQMTSAELTTGGVTTHPKRYKLLALKFTKFISSSQTQSTSPAPGESSSQTQSTSPAPEESSSQTQSTSPAPGESSSQTQSTSPAPGNTSIPLLSQNFTMTSIGFK